MLHGHQGQFIQTLDVVTESVIARGFRPLPVLLDLSSGFLSRVTNCPFYIYKDPPTKLSAVCVLQGWEDLSDSDQQDLSVAMLCVLWLLNRTLASSSS